ncbi:MAG: transposase [Lentisphaeria bacterium]
MEQQNKKGRIYRDWKSVFQEYRESGMTVKAFCEEQGISQGLFYKWRKRLREEAGITSAAAGFIELRRAGGSVPSGVSVTTAHGFRIELQPDFDAVTLERLLACLAGSAACSH